MLWENRSRCTLLIVMLVALLILPPTKKCALLAFAQQQSTDAGYDFVQEVLEEEKEHYGDREDSYATDEQIREQREADARRNEEQERLRKEEEDRIAQEQADLVRRKREEEFEKEVSRMNEDQRKKALRKKKHDAKVVKQILRAALQGDHYAVLGLRNLDIRIPPRTLGLGNFVLRFPGLRIFHVSGKDIRKAFRKLSVAVHPDRNRDGRAHEAFIALENSASILSDEQQRAEYDEKVRLIRQRRQTQATHAASQALSSIWNITTRAVTAFRTILGPFAFPVFILGSLIV